MVQSIGDPLAAEHLVITLQQIVDGRAPVRLVIHWPEGEWDFLSGKSYYLQEQVRVPYADLVKLDPSLMAIADLPEVWCARRKEHAGEWHRKWIYEGMPYQPLEERV